MADYFKDRINTLFFGFSIYLLFSAGSILGNAPAHHRSNRRLISTLPFLITEGKFEISRGATLVKWSRIRLFGGGGARLVEVG